MKSYKTVLFILFIFLISFEFSKAQVTRKVLFEEGTNASCGPCAANNPILIAYLQSHPTQIISIMYHASWPGVDPMYSANTTQNTERIQYNNITAVPTCNADGIIYDMWPYNNTNFDNALNARLAIPPPLSITVVDSRIAGDSIKSNITIVVNTTLPAGGNYYLRVMAVEKLITYTTPPGTNGEMVFHTVFRRAYPNTTGVEFPTAVGTYNYTYTYKREAAWIDTSMITVAFVQNHATKEVLNSGKGAYIPTGIGNPSTGIPEKNSLAQNYPNPFNPVTTIKFSLTKPGLTVIKVYDVLGRETAELLNEKTEAGMHSVNFDASTFTSGVYFYKITSGDYSEMKKMMLIK